MASKEDLKLEKEYQESLKISASSVGALQAQLQKILNSKKALKDSTKDYIKGLQKSTDSLNNSTSIQKKILSNQDEINKLKNGEHKLQQGSNKFTKAGTAAAIKSLEQQNLLLDVYGNQQAAIERVDEKAKGLKGRFDELIDKATGLTSNIPILGSQFGKVATKMGDSLKNKVGKAAQQFTSRYAAGLRSGMSSMKALGAAGAKAGSTMLGAFMGPQAIILLIVAALGAAFFALKQMEAGMKAFRSETGLVKGQMDGLEQTATNIGMKTMHLSGSLEEGAKLAGQMVKEFGSVEKLSADTLENAVKLSLSMGIGMENIAGTNKLFQNLNGLTEEQAQMMTTNVAKMAELADVSPNAVLKDMAESSEEITKYFKGTPAQLQKAAIQAAKFGTSLKQAGQVAGSLLDFESSINSELEASAILGTNLNLSRARGLAAQGDMVGAQQEVLKQASKLGDLSKLNVYEQEALAKAAGMPIGDLINQQRIKQKLGKLNEKEQKAMDALMKKGVDISKMTKAQAKEALKKQQIENKNVEATEIMTNQLKQQGLALASQLLPLATGFMKLISGLKPLFKGFIAPIMAAFKGIGSAFKTIQDAISSAFGKNSAAGGFSKILETIGRILSYTIIIPINLMANGIKMVASIAGGLVNIFKGIASMDMGMIFDGLKDVGEGILRSIYAVPVVLLESLGQMFPSVAAFFTNLWTKTKDILTEVFSGINPFKGLGETIKGPIESIKKSFGSIKETFSNIFSSIGEAFKPIKDAFASIFSGGGESGGFIKTLQSVFSFIGKIVAGTIGVVFNVIGEIMKPIAKIFGFIGKIVAGTIGVVFKVIANIVNHVGNVFKTIKGVLSGDIGIGDALLSIGESFLNIFTTIPGILWEGFKSVFGGLGEWLSEKFMLAVSSLGDFFSSLGDSFVGIFKSIGSKIKEKITGFLPNWAKKLIGAEPSDASEAQNAVSDGGSIDDGIVQNGKVITTNPKDTILATKDPSGLFGGVAEKAGGLFNMPNPLQDAASSIGSAIGGIFDNITGESEEKHNEKLLKKLDVLIDTVAAGAIINMDGEAVARTSGGKMDKALGRFNQFVRSNS